MRWIYLRGCAAIGARLQRWSFALPCREANRAAVEVCLDDGDQFGLDGHAAFLAAFSFDVNDCGAVVGGANVADVGLAEFLGAQAGENNREIALGPVGLASRAVVLRDGLQQGLDGGAEEPLWAVPWPALAGQLAASD